MPIAVYLLVSLVLLVLFPPSAAVLLMWYLLPQARTRSPYRAA